MRVSQDVRLHATLLEPGETIRQPLDPDRFGWLQVARGALDVSGGPALSAGDGLAIAQASALELTASVPTEALLFDLG